jgi:gas vesicle protein
MTFAAGMLVGAVLGATVAFIFLACIVAGARADDRARKGNNTNA